MEDSGPFGLGPNIHFMWAVEGIYIGLSTNQITLAELDSGKLNADKHQPLLPNPMAASGMLDVEKIELDMEGLRKIFNNNNGIWKLAFPPPDLEHMGPKPYKLDISKA